MTTSRVSTRCLAFSSIVGVLALSIGCGSASSPASPTTSAQGPGIDFTININGNLGGSSYSPSTLTMRVGQVVNWHNLDSIEHSATLDGGFNTGNIPAFSAHDDSVKMSRAGTFTYHCSAHPTMVGTIVVQ